MKILVDNDVERFIGSLEKNTIAKVLRTIDLLEVFGYKLRTPHSEPMGKGLFELRIRGQQEIRILYTFHKQTSVLLIGFIKKTQKTPKKEIEKALRKMKGLT